MLTIELPSMVAGRAMADALVDALDGDVTGEQVEVDCRHLVSGSPSFAAQLVRRLLVDGGAARVRVVAATTPFADAVTDAAERQGVAQHVSVVRTQAVPA